MVVYAPKQLPMIIMLTEIRSSEIYPSIVMYKKYRLKNTINEKYILQRNTYSAFDFNSVQLTRLAICKKTTGDVFIHFYPDLILDALYVSQKSA